MKKIVLTICLSFAMRPVLAQKINVDSLVQVAISRFGNQKTYKKPNRDSLFNRLRFADDDRERIKLIYKMINYGQETSKQALTYHYKILDWAKKNHNTVIEAVILSEVGFETAVNGDNAQGKKINFDALKLAEKTGSNQAIGIVYNNLGSCYSINNTADSANNRLGLFYIKQNLKYSQAGHDDLFTCYAYGATGYFYYLLHKPDSAIYFSQKGFEYRVQKNIPMQISADLLALGDAQTNDDLKLKYYREGARLANKLGDTVAALNASLDIAFYYKNHGGVDSGLFYVKRAYELSRYTTLNDKIRPSFLLMQLYKGRNTDSTLKYTNIYYTIRDSIYNIGKIEQAQATAYADQQRQQEAEAQKAAYRASFRFYLLVVIMAFLLSLAFIFWRNNSRNKRDKVKIQSTLDKLKTTQTQLVQREKMASLGELTAGIAHEIQNPLNFVNNFSDVNKELIDEMQLEIVKGDLDEIKAIANDIGQNEQKINLHGKRADAIVKGMLQHSQTGKGTKEPTDVNALANERLRLAYHAMQSKNPDFHAELFTSFDAGLPMISVIPQDIGKVLINLFNNAFYTVNQKAKLTGAGYKPEVSVTASLENGNIIIKVKDNGNGIPDAIKDKIMQPFFTTKPTGEGTGLGLSLSYDIVVKGHGGSITVNTKAGEFTEFTVSLPVA